MQENYTKEFNQTYTVNHQNVLVNLFTMLQSHQNLVKAFSIVWHVVLIIAYFECARCYNIFEEHLGSNVAQ